MPLADSIPTKETTVLAKDTATPIAPATGKPRMPLRVRGAEEVVVTLRIIAWAKCRVTGKACDNLI